MNIHLLTKSHLKQKFLNLFRVATETTTTTATTFLFIILSLGLKGKEKKKCNVKQKKSLIRIVDNKLSGLGMSKDNLDGI